MASIDPGCCGSSGVKENVSKRSNAEKGRRSIELAKVAWLIIFEEAISGGFNVGAMYKRIVTYHGPSTKTHPVQEGHCAVHLRTTMKIQAVHPYSQTIVSFLNLIIHIIRNESRDFDLTMLTS